MDDAAGDLDEGDATVYAELDFEPFLADLAHEVNVARKVHELSGPPLVFEE